MNYSAIYYKLVTIAMTRTPLEGYVERHHVIPRCMGGTNAKENIIELTAKEHLHAHRLLVRMYPKRKKLAYAVTMMCGGLKGRVALRMYEMDRKRHSAAAREQMLGTVGKNKGFKFGDEVRANMSKGSMGQNLGRKNTPETIEKMRLSAKARAERDKDIAYPKKSGWKHSEEAKAKMRAKRAERTAQ